jgi:hypothetical protein
MFADNLALWSKNRRGEPPPHAACGSSAGNRHHLVDRLAQDTETRAGPQEDLEAAVGNVHPILPAVLLDRCPDPRIDTGSVSTCAADCRQRRLPHGATKAVQSETLQVSVVVPMLGKLEDVVRTIRDLGCQYTIAGGGDNLLTGEDEPERACLLLQLLWSPPKAGRNDAGIDRARPSVWIERDHRVDPDEGGNIATASAAMRAIRGIFPLLIDGGEIIRSILSLGT